MTQTPAPGLTLADLSTLTQAQFTQRLGDIFEHSSWIAEGAWAARPFDNTLSLHQAMLAVLDGASEDAKLALIQAHPELAGKEAARGVLTHASANEQHSAGLDQCSAQELAELGALNAAYRERFGFPFVVAVKGLGRYEIMQALTMRLEHDRATEFAISLREIGKIARFRLDALLA